MTHFRIFLVILVLHLGSTIFWFKEGNYLSETVSTVLCFWIFLVGPVALIAFAKMAKEDVDWEDPQGFGGLLIRITIGTPLGCFGIVAMATGTGLLLFVAWSLLVQRDYEVLKSWQAWSLFLTMIVFGYGTLRYSFHRSGGLSRREFEQQQEQYRQDLCNADWAFYEDHLQRPIPAGLRRWYSVPENLYASYDFVDEVEFDFSQFEPIRADRLLVPELSGLPFPIVPIATIAFESWLFLKPGPSTDNRIWMIDPELPTEPEEVFESFENLVSALRLTGTDRDKNTL